MAGVTLKNPSDGKQALISNDNQLLVQSESLSLQHFISRYRGQMYQAQFFDAGLTSGTNVVGHLKNNSPTLSLVLAYLRVQVPVVAGGTAIGSNTANYWTFSFEKVYASGGSAITPVNMNRSSGNSADITAYDTNPTLTGTGTEFDRMYVDSNSQLSYRKEGSIILGPNDTMDMTFITDNTSGTAYCRISFMLIDLNN